MVKETSNWLVNLDKKIVKQEAIKKPLDRDEEIYKYAFEIARRVNTVKRTEKYLKEYSKVLNRKVVNVERPDDPESDKDFIITISGAEIGRFWFRKEFETGIIER